MQMTTTPAVLEHNNKLPFGYIFIICRDFKYKFLSVIYYTFALHAFDINLLDNKC